MTNKEIKEKKQDVGYHDKPLYRRCRACFHLIITLAPHPNASYAGRGYTVEPLSCRKHGFPVKPNAICSYFQLDPTYKA